MSQKNVLNTVIEEIYHLESYVQSWRDKENVPTIERDLVKTKLQQIYDWVSHLDSDVTTVPDNSKIATKEIISQEKEISVAGPIHEILFEKTTEIIEEPRPIINEIPVKTEPVKQVIEVTVSKTEVQIEKIEKAKEATKENLSEKHTQTHKVINETVKSRSVMDVSSKLKATPIPSIQSAINLNEKFVFTRELFKNNSLLYNQTIERLNNAKDCEEAIAIVEKEFSWDMNDAIVMKLVELIKRKHNA